MGYAADSMGTLGILGGGQLARMTALAARTLGYRVQVLDPSATCPASAVVDRVIVASYDDLDAALELARACDVVTLDVEHLPSHLLQAVGAQTDLHPRASCMHIVQNRGRQKEWLQQNGFPVGPFRVVNGAAALATALSDFGDTAFIKATQGGFDGRAQRVVSTAADAREVLAALGTEHVTVELRLDLEAELSVLVARRSNGEVAVYPPALNHHEESILCWSMLPAPLPASLVEQARDLALRIALELDVTGLCVVEMFVLADHTLLVNEIALRPHNSYHGSERAVETSQFEQHVRAVFDLPLGQASVVRPTAMANLLGELWLGASPPNLELALGVPTVRLQLYGKSQARPGRKLGHLTATGATPEEALNRVLSAKNQLRGAAAPLHSVVRS